MNHAALVFILLLASCTATSPASVQPASPVNPTSTPSKITIVAIPAPAKIYLPVIQYHPSYIQGVSVSQEADKTSCYDAQILNADWWYNWDKTPRYGCEYSDKFVPMVWGLDINYLWTLKYATKSGWLMGFNEPDMANQANISPRNAAVFWRTLEVGFADVKLLSPAPSQSNPGWLKQMAREYETLYGTQPRFDAVAVHIYYQDVDTAIRYIEARHSEWPDKKLWVTEFSSCLWIKDPDWRKTSALAEWMEQQPYIDRYAWFVARENWIPDTKNACTLIRDNQLTAPGVWFRGH